MGTRVVNGNDHTENGWPMADQDGCTWTTIPGTNPIVHLQIQSGQPLAIMRAYVADHHAFVEPVHDDDSACWTPSNDVLGEPGQNNGSNHLGGTAMDLRWQIHKFHESYSGYNQAQIDTVREILDFYEGTIFWGEDWGLQGNGPFDCMHFQMGYNTFQNPHTQDFINRKIRSDGFSTFRRSSVVPLSRTDQYALAVIVEGHKRNISPRGIQIALTVPFVESGWQMYANSNIPASLTFPHDKVGSDHDSTGLFQQRQAWGPLSCTMDPSCSAGLFYDGGHAGQRGLTDFDYDSNTRTAGGWAQAVQVSAFPDRYDEHFGQAVDLYNKLSHITPPDIQPVQPVQPPGEDDFLSALTPDEQRALFNAIMNKRESRAPLRHVGEGPIGDTPDVTWNIDGSVHLVAEMLLTLLLDDPDPDSVALLQEIAEVDLSKHPERKRDRSLARAILNTMINKGRTTTAPMASPSASVVYSSPTAAVAVTSLQPEVLPAVRRPMHVSGTPEEMLHEVDRAIALKHELDKRLPAAITDGDKK